MHAASKVSDLRNPTSRVLDVAGVILAGGKSSRYGKNKALEEFRGLSLIERVCRVMRSVFRNVVLITNSPEEYTHLEIPMEEDLKKGLGPIGGILTALRTIPQDAGFFVACDMPFLNPELIRYMVKQRGEFDAVVPVISGKMEALHALYGKQCLPAVEHLISSGNLQIFRFFPEVSVRYITEEEIRAYDPRLASFLNVNSPQELRRLKGPC